MDKPDIQCPEHTEFTRHCYDCVDRLSLAYRIQRQNYLNLTEANLRMETFWHEVNEDRNRLRAALKTAQGVEPNE